jgi:FKBP-type peptidyl-prolyl cis-trans isomerase
MKKTLFSIVAVAIVLSACAQKGKSKVTLKNSTDSVSYALGVSIAENFAKSDLPKVDYDIFLKGIKERIDSVAQMEPMAADQYIRQLLSAESAKKAEVAKKAGIEWLAQNKTKPGVITTPSGLQYKVVSEGTGASPKATDRVTVHYHGTLTDGTVFDSSVERGQPATFGLNQVIPGWTEGLQLMKEGGKTIFYIPENLAYGSRAQGKIPAYSPLVFEVELIKIETSSPEMMGGEK